MKFPLDPEQWPDGRPSIDNPGPTALRWQSSGGLWRVQVDPVIFGWRVHVARRYPLHSIDATPIPGMRPMDWPSYEVVYCCGDNRMATTLVPKMVMRALEAFNEDAQLDRVRGAFPVQSKKPIENDRRCWLALAAAAGLTRGMARAAFRLIQGQAGTAPPVPVMQILLEGAQVVHV